MNPKIYFYQTKKSGITSQLFRNFLFTIIFFSVTTMTNAQTNSSDLWQEATESSIQADRSARRIIPETYRTMKLNKTALMSLLDAAPLEFTESARTTEVIFPVPMPDGTFEHFSITNSPIMEEGLAAKFPEIKTFVGQGLDDPSASVYLDWTYQGFHLMILSNNGAVFIDPYSQLDLEHYIIYYKKDFIPSSEKLLYGFCMVSEDANHRFDMENEQAAALYTPSGTELRTYRLALAATGEYTAYHGGTVVDAMSAMTTTMNRVNGIYRREVAIRMVFIANNDDIIYTSTTDPYTNGDAGAMINENQSNITTEIGSANFDIGHVFGTNSGGLAGPGPCNNGTKARGITGSGNPIGDPFDVDYVAHEMGHQFGASHTFNGDTDECLANRDAGSAYEPGSGSTIMAYAGICGSNDLQPNSDDYFHSRSFDEIVSYSTVGTGNNCPVVTATSNNPPTVNAGTGGFTIPYGTPFTLTGSAADPDGDPLTYCWEQYDLGPQGSPNSPAGDAPIFRSFDPISSPSRTFPRLSDILNNTQTLGEILPSYGRNLNFRLTARDNLFGGGGVDYDDIGFVVSGLAGPFVVTSQSTSTIWNPSMSNMATITWDVAGSTDPPVNCADVNILLSLDGGQTFPIVLQNNTPNDGSQQVVIPAVVSCTARIKVECSDNIFFNINNGDFVIDSEAPTFIQPASDRVVECDGMGNVNGPMGLNAWLASNGGAVATDNCDPTLSWSNMLINTSIVCAGNITFTYRFTAEDDAGNTAFTDGEFHIVDTTPPDIICPANITISCDESDDPSFTGTANATDICSAPDLIYSDMLVSGNCSWVCTIERTWVAEDDCGNMNSCIQEIHSTPLMLIQQALSSGPIVVGLPGVSLTLTLADAECIVEWLSPGFGTAAPSAIPWGNHSNNPATCLPGSIVINPDGTMANPLLAAQIFMAINLRLEPMLGTTLLSDTGVPVDMVLIISMRRNPTVNELFRLTNIALGNIYAPHLDFLTQSVQGINDAYHFCNGDVGPIVQSIGSNSGNIYDAEGLQVQSINLQNDFSIYPNPANDRVFFDLKGYSGQSLIIEIYNLQGQLLVRQEIDEVYDSPLLFNLDNFKDAVYMGVIHTESKEIKTKKFLVKKQ